MGTGTYLDGNKRLMASVGCPRWAMFFFLTERSEGKSLDTVVNRETTLRTAKVHGQETFLFSKTYRHALGITQLPLQWAPALFPGAKAVGA